jgi:hypothetical protein
MTKQQTSPAVASSKFPEQHLADGREVLDPVAFEIEDDLFRAAALNDLAHWIGQAQNFIASVRLAVEQDERTKGILDRRGLSLGTPGWLDHHATGLDVLHMTIDQHLAAVRRIAGLEARSSVSASTASTSEGPGNAH